MISPVKAKLKNLSLVTGKIVYPHQLAGNI